MSHGSANSPERFPASRRILKRADFQRVYHEGTRIGGSLFTTFVREHETAGPARVGLTVTRKVGKAVVRNRCKRRLREAVRRHWDLFPDGVDIILHARGKLTDASAEEVESEIIRVLRKAAKRLHDERA